MMNTVMETWIEVCALTDIPRRGARVMKTPLGCVALFRTQDDAVFALDDTCPHKQGPLAQGIVHGRSVTCPLHNWVIDLATGEAQGADEGKTRTYKTQVIDDRVMVDRAVLSQGEG